MSVGPILPGRLPSSLAAMRLQEHLQGNRGLLSHLQDQIGTGQKFFFPSESPAAALRTIVLQRTIERKTQMQVNVSVDRSMLGATDTALASVSDALNQAKSLLVAGTGDTVSADERRALTAEAGQLLAHVLRAANTEFRGRYLFGGSRGTEAPFEHVGSYVRYSGDRRQLESFVDFGFLLPNNVDGVTAFRPLAVVDGGDLNPALTSTTKIGDLNAGRGVALGSIVVTVDDGAIPATVGKTIDLSSAQTIGDIETILEDAFAGEAITLDVDIDPVGQSGLRITASSGTVQIQNAHGSATATQLRISGGPAASVIGNDLDPRITMLTALDALHAGTGIARTPGQGLRIEHAGEVHVVDLSDPAIETLEDLLNTLRLSDPNLDLELNAAGTGITVVSRLSGAELSIGENGDTTASDLGIRTLTGQTFLADLNFGQGIPTDAVGAGPVELEITRRDGTVAVVDLTNLGTLQEVIDAIAADSGLTAELNSVGNGITITDVTGGTGTLAVKATDVSNALGIAGEAVGDTLIGQDFNRVQSTGVFGILTRLQHALESGDNRELSRLDQMLTAETERFTVVRGEVGARLRALDDLEARLLDEDVQLRESLSRDFDVDLAEAITQFSQQQRATEALMQVSAIMLQLNLFAFL